MASTTRSSLSLDRYLSHMSGHKRGPMHSHHQMQTLLLDKCEYIKGTRDASKNTEGQENFYALPRDGEEHHRLIVQSHLLLRIFDNKVVHAPVDLQDGDWVLDSGTGSGAWLRDIVEQIPTKPQYIGIDIKPNLFPEPSTQPPNVKFEIQSVTALPKEWTNKFTLVHQRLLIAGLRQYEWETALGEIYGVLKPGGWVQLLEWRAWAAGPALAKYQDALFAFSDDVGLLVPDIAQRLSDLLKKSGFIDVHEVTHDIPSSPCRGQDGVDGKLDTMGIVRGYMEPILKKGGYGIINSETEGEELLEDISKELDNTPESTISFTMFWAQKPLE